MFGPHKGGEQIMDKERVKGGAEQAKGRVEKAVGDLTGDKDKQAQGSLTETEGKVRTSVGKLKDKVKEVIK
jgi:uncharacterized protein YjbJ (UPF0337 family)